MPDRDFQNRERAHEVLEALAATSPATTAELASALETHPVTVERCCRALQRAGYVRQCTGGVYTLVEPETDTDPTAPSPADAPADRPTSTNPAD